MRIAAVWLAEGRSGIKIIARGRISAKPEHQQPSVKAKGK